MSFINRNWLSLFHQGLDETLTVLALGLPDRLEQTLRATNPIDNIFGGVRDRTRRVKQWKGGRMILRWCAAAVLEAETAFRRIRALRFRTKFHW